MSLSGDRTVGVSEVRRPRTRRFVTVDRGIIARGIHEPCKPSRRFLSGFSQDLLVKRRRIVAALVAAVRATAVARNLAVRKHLGQVREPRGCALDAGIEFPESLEPWLHIQLRDQLIGLIELVPDSRGCHECCIGSLALVVFVLLFRDTEGPQVVSEWLRYWATHL